MEEKLTQLIDRLLSQTRSEKRKWEYFSDERVIRTDVSKGLVRIGQFWYSYDGDRLVRDISFSENAPEYLVELLDERGNLTDEIEIKKTSKAYESTHELYKIVTTRLREKNTGKLLDEILLAIG